MNFSLIVRRLGTKLLRTEQAVDTAVEGVAELLAESYAAQKAANYHGSVTQPAQSDLIEALELMNQARAKVLAFHEKAAAMQAEAGDRTVLSGYQYKMDSLPQAQTAIAESERTAA